MARQQAYEDDFFNDPTAPAAPAATSAAPTPAPVTGSAQDFGSPVLNRIAGYFRSAGIQPTYQMVTQWGGNIDQAFEQKIRQQIFAWAQPSGPQTPPSGGGNGDHAAFGRAWLASGGKTPADLAAFVAAHPEYGAEIFGSNKQKVKIGGRSFDAVLQAGAGGNGASWDDITDGEGGGGGGVGQSELLAPWTQAFTPPEAANLPDFVAPTGITEENDPGFQARMKLGSDALQHSAAARGTLLTGGTLKGLMQFGQDFASNEFGNVYNRALQDYGTKYGKANDTYARAAGEYDTARSNFYNNQDRPFDKLFSMSQLDSQNMNAANANNLGWAGLFAGTAQGGANAYNGYATDAAAAQAAGRVGSANAYNSLFGNLTNTGLGLYYANQMGRQPRY
jgi:hypothetical protein